MSAAKCFRWQNGGGAQLYSDSLLEHTAYREKREARAAASATVGGSASQPASQPVSERKRKKRKKQVARKDELRRKKRREVLARREIISLLGERAPLDKLIFSMPAPLRSCNASSITNQSMGAIVSLTTVGQQAERREKNVLEHEVQPAADVNY